MADELKPCPFCGGEAEHAVGKRGNGEPWEYIECGVCGATADGAIAWNTRAAPPPEPSEAEIQAIAEAYCERKNISDYRLTPQDVYEAHKDGQRAALAAWNTRAAPAPEPSEAEVEAVARAIYGTENPQGRLWEDRADGTQSTYLALARAAIAAMRVAKEKEHG